MNKLIKITEGRIRPLLLCFLAGALGAIPYYAESLWIFTLVSLLIQYSLAIGFKKRNKYFSPFFWYYLGLYIPLYSFLSELYPFERFGFTASQAVFVTVCACVCIPLLHASVLGLVMKLSCFLPYGAVGALGYASLAVICEFVLTLGGLAFPWGTTAVSMTGFLPYVQTASLFGQYFITFITAFFCASVAYCVFGGKRILAYISAGIILFNTAVGTAIYFLPVSEEKTVTAGLIQGNASSEDKWQSSSLSSITAKYLTLTEDAAQQGAELIILPESAIPSKFIEGGSVHMALADIAAEYNATVLLGAVIPCEGGGYNSVIGILPDGTLTERYDKRHLVPFGEYIPSADFLGKFLPFVAELNEDGTQYVEGVDPIVIKTESGSVGPLVCFDSLFSSFARDARNNGAEILAIVTNDSWFYDSQGVYTHLRHAQLRAIETGTIVMRAANTGISAFVDCKGRIIESAPPLTTDVLVETVSVSGQNTLFNIFGNTAVYASFAILAIIIILYFVRRRPNGKNTASQQGDI